MVVSMKILSWYFTRTCCKVLRGMSCQCARMNGVACSPHPLQSTLQGRGIELIRSTRDITERHWRTRSATATWLHFSLSHALGYTVPMLQPIVAQDIVGGDTRS